MQLKLIKSLWGMNGSLESQIQQIAEAGYTGVEAAIGYMDNREELSRLLAQYKLELIAQVITKGNSAEDHIHSFKEQVAYATHYGAILVDAHGGKDSFDRDQLRQFYDAALNVEASLGVPIGHETHRGRPLFTPWTTAALLREFPELKLTADISHWLCVCESYLDDHAEALQLAAQRTLHIHARVGYPQGPQVPHPAAPEFERELYVHEAFWEAVLVQSQAEHRPFVTMTPEYGPPGYLHTLPFTKQPVSDLWEVCSWMAKRFSSRFASYFAPTE
ncbi:sugar phosphate isomerase/epimerase family protein [Paenibacillus aestuarii]|uniref:Sugar phosphate isomerase/epimerase family protein n=1 Tax=Paenibacillus aestuarii TaxID=516965 RepID=A0ABW0KG30_9BACL|nr:TIM barrel protein [Paenibacillus aestuarii]